jgi:predicted nuclease of predicted toxin-antitoxin system
VKLLFDENLSPKLVEALADIFPESAHVDRLGMGSADDDKVWQYARQHAFTLVSKDSDFHEKSLLHGTPPKVVWIRRGNCTTRQIEILLRDMAGHITNMNDDPEAAYLILL